MCIVHWTLLHIVSDSTSRQTAWVQRLQLRYRHDSRHRITSKSSIISSGRFRNDNTFLHVFLMRASNNRANFPPHLVFKLATSSRDETGEKSKVSDRLDWKPGINPWVKSSPRVDAKWVALLGRWTAQHRDKSESFWLVYPHLKLINLVFKKEFQSCFPPQPFYLGSMEPVP